jgi:hypothetical protein
MKALSVLGAVNRFPSVQNPLHHVSASEWTGVARRRWTSRAAGRAGRMEPPSTLGQTRKKLKKCCPDKSKRNGMRVFPS